MDQTAIPWIMLWSAVAATASAIAAAVSACISSRSSRTAADAAATSRDIAATNLILKFRDQYASDEMLFDLCNLRAWQDKYDSQFAETWRQKLNDDKEAKIVDGSRRRVTSFFHNILDLHARRVSFRARDSAGTNSAWQPTRPSRRHRRAVTPPFSVL